LRAPTRPHARDDTDDARRHLARRRELHARGSVHEMQLCRCKACSQDPTAHLAPNTTRPAPNTSSSSLLTSHLKRPLPPPPYLSAHPPLTCPYFSSGFLASARAPSTSASTPAAAAVTRCSSSSRMSFKLPSGISYAGVASAPAAAAAPAVVSITLA